MSNIKFEKVGELFCGPGGSGIGSSLSNKIINDTSVNIRHIWAAYYDEDSCSTYKNNIEKFENKKFGINEEIKVYNIDLNDNSVDLSDNKMFPYIDGLIFGFPCNDFSLVGQSKGLYGNYGPLYKHGIKILKRKDNPKWFIAENVSGLASSNEGKAFKQILTEMQNAGYKLNAHKYKFEEYGIPQRRHRIIIVGIRNPIDRNLSYLFQTCSDNFCNSVGTKKNNYNGELCYIPGVYDRKLKRYATPEVIIDLYFDARRSIKIPGLPQRPFTTSYNFNN